MKVSRLTLDPRSRETRALLHDAHQLHRWVMRAFPPAAGAPRQALGVLHRLEADARTGELVLYVQSAEAPDWSFAAGALAPAARGENPAVVDIGPTLDGLSAGALCAFRLRANVTRKVDTRSGPDGARRNGRRVPLRDHAARVAWLERKAAAAGFALVRGVSEEPEVRVTDEAPQRGRRDDAPLTHEGVRFDGLLRVTDPAALRAAVAAGVGPGKAYGFGLLSLRPM